MLDYSNLECIWIFITAYCLLPTVYFLKFYLYTRI